MISMSPNIGRKTDNHIHRFKVIGVHLFTFFSKFVSTLLNRGAKWFIAIFYITLARPIITVKHNKIGVGLINI